MSVKPVGEGKHLVNFMVEGERVRVTVNMGLREARAWELEARAAVMRGQELPGGYGTARGSARGPGPKTIGALVTWVTEHHWNQLKAAETMTANATLFARFVGRGVAVKDALTTEKVNEYLSSLRKRNRAEATVNRHKSAISVLVKYAKDPSLCDLKKGPAMPKAGKESEGRLRHFTPQEFDAICRQLHQWGLDDQVRFYQFLVDTGARFSEAIKLRWGDVTDGGRRVVFVNRKSGRTTGCVLTARCVANLAHLRTGKALEEAGPFTWVSKGGSTSLWRRLQDHLPFLVDAVPHHTFRHTTASWLVQRGVDLYRVMEYMDHSTITVTQRYAHLSPKHLAEAVAALEAVQLGPVVASAGLEPAHPLG